jgi:hypothetical protein
LSCRSAAQLAPSIKCPRRRHTDANMAADGREGAPAVDAAQLLARLAASDAVLEPDIMSVVALFARHGGQPTQV